MKITLNPNQDAPAIYIYNKSVGWWDGEQDDIYKKALLTCSELSEWLEADRKNLMDDKLPHRLGVEVELADAYIRLCDIGGRWGWKYSELPYCYEWLEGDATIYKQMVVLQKRVLAVATSFNYAKEQKYDEALNVLLFIAKTEGYDLVGAANEKFEFNKTRSDHQTGTRQKRY